MNKQEIFDTVMTHLLKQGVQSTNSAGHGCRYRSEGGLKCAVGCLIPDEMYNPELDDWSINQNTSINWLANHTKYDFPEYFREEYNIELLNSLQKMHDHFHRFSVDEPSFMNRAKQIAERFKLEFKYA